MADNLDEAALEPAGDPAGMDDIAAALAEFDQQTKKPEAATVEKPAESPARTNTPANPNLGPHGLPYGDQHNADQEAALRDQTRDLEFSTLKKWAQNIDKERSAELDRRDFARIVDGANETLRQQLGDRTNFLPEGYAEAWLKNQFTLDANLYAKLNNRYASPEATALAEHATKNAIRSLVDQVRKIPDREATEDRDMVAMAVRGSAGKAPERKAPNYGKMTDREFADAIESEHGYRPGVA
jgi:hypothetical protein